MNLTDMKTFALVAQTGTVSGAAAKLGVPKSTVSRRINRLEDDLGQELFRRSARAVTLSELGQTFFQRISPSLQELESAVDTLTQSTTEPAGVLRITTVPGFGHSHDFLACIRDYGIKYPKTKIDLELTTRLVNLVEEGFDIGVRLHVGQLPGSSDLISRRLLQFGRAIYASPDYLREHQAPNSFEDLVKHFIAAHSIVDVRATHWTRQGKLQKEPLMLPSPRWLINDASALERFALSGGGLALMNTVEGDRLVAQGRLSRILPDYEQAPATATLVWPSSRHLAPRIRAFIDLAVDMMGGA